MAKDVNIHIKAKGTDGAKRNLDSVGRSAQKVGTDTKGMGEKAKHGSNLFVEGLKKIAGPLGFAAILAVVARVAVKIATFFDNIKTRCDDAVRNLQQVRGAFEDLFEAMGAFDEKERKQVSASAVSLLKETSVSKQIGLPIINAYTRQFKGLVESGQLTEEQYQQGLKGMLGYGARHGQEATPELISLMAGWEMVTPGQQGVFRRQIAAGAQASGLTDAELIGALGRGMPTIKAMGWTPEQAVQTIATLAAGETGRKKMSLPATTLQSLMAPQVANFEKYGIPEELGQDPQQLLTLLTMKQGQMDQKAFLQILTGIYGIEGAAGVYKLVSKPRADIGAALRFATVPGGVAAEQAEEATSRKTMERVQAHTDAAILERQLDVTNKEMYEAEVRRIGEAEQTRRERRMPVKEWFFKRFTWGKEKEKEEIAFKEWMKSLSPEERRKILKEEDYEYGPIEWPLYERWESMSPQEQYEAVTRTPQGRQEGAMGATVINQHFHNELIFNPISGSAADRDMGPRADNELKF